MLKEGSIGYLSHLGLNIVVNPHLVLCIRADIRPRTSNDVYTQLSAHLFAVTVFEVLLRSSKFDDVTALFESEIPGYEHCSFVMISLSLLSR